MEKIKNIRLRTDNSEIIPYTIESIPIYAVREQQSNYPNMCGIMHWHDDIEFIRIVSGRMNYLVNDNVIELNEEDIIFVNSQQIHGHVGIYVQLLHAAEEIPALQAQAAVRILGARAGEGVGVVPNRVQETNAPFMRRV